MGSFGRNLRRERELRGISVEEIAQHTKIGTRMLEAIESDRFELLPGGVFNRSFVLHYARYLGLDEQKVGAEFDLFVGVPQPVDLQQLAAQRDSREVAPPLVSEPPPVRWLRVALAAVLGGALFVAVGLGVKEWWPALAGASGPGSRPAQAPAAPSPRPALSGDSATTSAPAPASGAMESPAPGGSVATVPAAVQPASSALVPTAGAPAAAPAGGPSAGVAGLRLQIDTMEPSSVTAYGDGRKLWSAYMRAHETRTVTAESQIRLRVNNAGAVVLTLNGETQAPLGHKGEAKTVVFSAEDLKKQ